MNPDTALVPQPTLDDFPEFASIPLRVARNARLYPDKRAAMCEGTVRTWRAFDRRINQIARTLAGMGVGRGDKIAILAANSVEYLETFMGGLRAGACVVPVSTPEEAQSGQVAGIYYKDDLIAAPMHFADGAIEVPTAPGLGIAVDEAKVKRYLVGKA